MNRSGETLDLPFSRKYDEKHSRAYFQKHRSGMLRQLSHLWEERMLRKALDFAGQPNSVLDLPSGAGRFWPLLMEKKNRIILAADYSEDMLRVAWESNQEIGRENITCLQMSAFDIRLAESSVDCIFCVRLLHHIGFPQDRAVLLKEFRRVARDTVIFTLWVDGNYKAWRRKKSEEKRKLREDKDFQNRFVLPRRQVEEEFREAGFEILAHIDHLPFYQMWRTYVLRKK